MIRNKTLEINYLFLYLQFSPKKVLLRMIWKLRGIVNRLPLSLKENTYFHRFWTSDSICEQILKKIKKYFFSRLCGGWIWRWKVETTWSYYTKNFLSHIPHLKVLAQLGWPAKISNNVEKLVKKVVWHWKKDILKWHTPDTGVDRFLQIWARWCLTVVKWPRIDMVKILALKVQIYPRQMKFNT